MELLRSLNLYRLRLHQERFSRAWHEHGGPVQLFPRCLHVYGFSIVKHNPKEKTIHFGGIKGQAIRQRYINMPYDTLDKDVM